jgi:lipopolysaccharide/colanic/teichoic acid biosynthesis glycosyltransferase
MLASLFLEMTIWWTLMLGKTLGLKQETFGRPAKGDSSRAKRRQNGSTNLFKDHSAGPLGVKSNALSGLTAACMPQIQTTSRASKGPFWVEPIPRLGLFVKRIMDLMLASIVIVFLWPVMLVIAFAVRLESRGPVIYASLRVGKRGRIFNCYKFRTMVAGADAVKDGLRHLNQRRGPFFKIADDPRVTPLGRFLRRYSLDELPQLWNVLKGDMSLVGPRPHPLDDSDRYSPEHHRRLEVKPGITGLWQVTARTNPSFDACMLMDLGYMRNWSLLLDCEILMRTIPVVLAGEGQ